jgi:peptidoglycan/LPS O-acetylase OafA/YrhL
MARSSFAMVRNILVLVLLMLLAAGCAASGDTGTQKTINALMIAGIAGIFIAILVLVALWISSRRWPPSYRGGVVGFLFGLIIAAVIIRRVPIETQLVAIGAILGLGADFVTSLKDPEGPKTVINRIAKMIVGAIAGIGDAAAQSGLKKPREQVIAGGLWCFLGTILFTLVIGNLF